MFPNGLCQMISDLNMTEVNRLQWIGYFPNLAVYVTDPKKKTDSSIDLNSQIGDEIRCEVGNICTYEVSIAITDLRSPVEPDTCSDKVTFSACADQLMKETYHKVNK